MIWLAGGLLLKLSFKFEFLLQELRIFILICWSDNNQTSFGFAVNYVRILLKIRERNKHNTPVVKFNMEELDGDVFSFSVQFSVEDTIESCKTFLIFFRFSFPVWSLQEYSKCACNWNCYSVFVKALTSLMVIFVIMKRTPLQCWVLPSC